MGLRALYGRVAGRGDGEDATEAEGEVLLVHGRRVLVITSRGRVQVQGVCFCCDDSYVRNHEAGVVLCYYSMMITSTHAKVQNYRRPH